MDKTTNFFFKFINRVKKQKPKMADAIVWIQGDRYDRGKKTLSLYRNKWAKKIVLTGNNELVGKRTAKGTDNITLLEMDVWLRGKGVPARHIILEDHSFNTAEQARNVIALAKSRKWKKIFLVASFYHQPRVALTFFESSRELKWGGMIVNQPTNINWHAVPGGRKQTAKELSAEEIKKIRKYKLDRFLEKLIQTI